METTVSLVQMLDARERRVQHQQELLAQYHKPLICFTMNICGPIKDSPLIRRGFARGRQLLRQQFLRAKLTPLYQDAVREVTGCEAFYVLDADPLTIKKFTTDIEDATPLGRLFDMDVIRPDGLKVDREELKLEGRCCLICGGPAKVCSSRRVHTVAELQEKTTEILTEARDAQDIADAARLAVRALLYEVTTTPKPGLVDRRNSGSHKDMDVFTFMDSAAALYPYFEACARTGRETAEQPAPETFAALRPLGCEAEGEMLDATGGVNTHKGAVFSVGIVCAELGRLDRSLWAEAARVLAEVSAMTAGLTEKDFAGVTAENAATVGQKLYIPVRYHRCAGAGGSRTSRSAECRSAGAGSRPCQGLRLRPRQRRRTVGYPGQQHRYQHYCPLEPRASAGPHRRAESPSRPDTLPG